MVAERNVPVSITPSSEELDEGILTARNLEIAIRALHQDGLVIIRNVYHHEDLDKLNQVMVRDALKMAELGDAGPKNFHPGNLVYHSTSAKVILLEKCLPQPDRHAGHLNALRSQAKVDLQQRECRSSIRRRQEDCSSVAANSYRRLL